MIKALLIKFAALFILATNISLCNAEWIHLASTPEGELYADRYEIYRTKDYAFFNTILNYKEEKDDFFPEYRMKTSSTSGFNQIDCKENTSETVRVTAYSRKFASGASLLVPKTRELERKVKLDTASPIGKLAEQACSMHPSGWTAISQFEGENMLFMDFSSIHKDKTKINLMFNFSNTDLTKAKSSFLEMNFDCNKYTYTLTHMQSFSEKYLNGQMLKNLTAEVQFNEVEGYPSVMFIAGKIACQ